MVKSSKRRAIAGRTRGDLTEIEHIEQIMATIFRKLLVTSLISCKQVIKQWYNLITKVQFTRLHFHSNLENIKLVLYIKPSNSRPLDLQLVDKDACVLDLLETDVISALEFDKTGNNLAAGDHGGRVVLLEKADSKEHDMSRRDLEEIDRSLSGKHVDFRYKMEFQSHEPEFDYVKSSEIVEKINKIRWCHGTNCALFLLSTNDKTIKYWKVQDKKVKKVCDVNADSSKASGNCSHGSSSRSSNLGNGLSTYAPGTVNPLRLPVVTSSESHRLFAGCMRVYANAHEFQNNLISYNRFGSYQQSAAPDLAAPV